MNDMENIMKTSQEMKELVENFIKVTKIEYEDQTDKIKNKGDVIDWQYRVGTNVIVSKNSNRDDRIHINVNMRFPQEDSKLLTSKNQAFAKTIMEISHICTVCNVGHQWIKENDLIVGLAIFSHVDELVLDRINFHNTWDNVVRVSGHTQKILRSNFSGFKTANNTDSNSQKSIYG